MPYRIREGGADCPFEVQNEDSGERVACHPSREKALAHMQALYAHVSDAEQRGDRAEIEHRTADVQTLDVDERFVRVRAVPYGEPATVMFRGDVWTEYFEPGAFDQVINRPNRIRVNREHIRGNTCGKVIALRSEPTGLIADVRIANTPLGMETLALAREDCLSASVGFGALPKWTRIDMRNKVRRIERAHLDHLSFVETPAYAGAEVLEVRGYVAEAAMPYRSPDIDVLAEDPVFRWADGRLNTK